jgi:SAM-dependent methyltransferase
LPRVQYSLSDNAPADFEAFVHELASRDGCKRILDVGGGANPLLPLDFIQRHGIEYTVLDISGGELDKAPADYVKALGDICHPSLRLCGRFDLVFSRMVAEHVRDGEAFHRNVQQLLVPKGVAVHIFPTLYALPFLVNRWFSEKLTSRLLDILQPGIRRKEGKQRKFPAYYSWCRGPSKRQLDRLGRLGYRVERYIGYFGHAGYYQRIKPLLLLNQWLQQMLLRHPLPLLTSYAVVVVRREMAGVSVPGVDQVD